jgi:hypothetical protein
VLGNGQIPATQCSKLHGDEGGWRGEQADELPRPSPLRRGAQACA